MRTVTLLSVLLVARAASAQQDALPPPPPPPAAPDDAALAPPPPPPAWGTTEAPAQRAPPAAQPPAAQSAAPAAPPAAQPAAQNAAPASAPPPRRATPPGTIGDGPLAPAGSPAAPLQPYEASSHWSSSLATGLAGRWGGMQLSSTEANSAVMIFFGGQADGVWSVGPDELAKALRLRIRLFTGGEGVVFVPSDGDAEAAFALGRRELRFVLGWIETSRWPALGLQFLLQAATLPSFEGSIAFAGDRLRFAYGVAPVALAYAWYYRSAHIPPGVAGWPQETSSPSAASSARARLTATVPPSVQLSLYADFMQMWQRADAYLALEGSAGIAVLDGSVLLSVVVAFQRYTRRGLERDTSVTDEEVKLLAAATLAF